MQKIKVQKPDTAMLEALDVVSWPTWSKEVSTFAWSYNSQEIAYIIEGEVSVTDKETGEIVSFGKGDLVTFSAGLTCTWQVKKALHKHYQFE